MICNVCYDKETLALANLCRAGHGFLDYHLVHGTTTYQFVDAQKLLSQSEGRNDDPLSTAVKALGGFERS